MRRRANPVNNIIWDKTAKLIDMTKQLTDGKGVPYSAKIFCVNQRRGSCKVLINGYTLEYIITVPLWAFTKGDDYALYYLAHELAHSHSHFYDAWPMKHDENFYRYFKMLCPAHLQHHEIGYKPRNAQSAGIKKVA